MANSEIRSILTVYIYTYINYTTFDSFDPLSLSLLRPQMANYEIRILVAASREYVDTFSTCRFASMSAPVEDDQFIYMRYNCIYIIVVGL